MATAFSEPRFIWHNDDYRSVCWAVALFCLVLSVSSVFARLFYRQYASAFNIDDAPVAGLLVLVIVCGALQMGLVSKGLGLTLDNILPQSRSYVSAGVFANFVLFFIATGCSKLSLALTCKITVFDDKRLRSRYVWALPGAMFAIVLLGAIGTGVIFRPQELHTANSGQFTSLRTIFIVFLTLDSFIDLCTIGLMGYEILQLQISARSRNRIICILIPRLGSIPVSVFLCRSIKPEKLANDFTLQIWHLAAFLSLSLLISSITTSLIAMGASLEGFDIRAQTDFAMSTMHSRPSPGHTKFSQTNSGVNASAYDRTTKIDGGDASSDQVPILPEDANSGGGIYVSRTVEHREEHTR